MRLVTATPFLAGIAPRVAAQAPDTVSLTLAAVMDANGQVRESLAAPRSTGAREPARLPAD